MGFWLAACGAAGADAFKRGQALEAEGKLAAARAEYQKAAQDNPQYQTALSQAEQALTEKTRMQARAAEEARDWQAAASAWKQAFEVSKDQDDGAKAALAAARGNNPSVDDWYAAAVQAREEYPESSAAQEAVASAKEEAYAFHGALAKEALEKKDGKVALAELKKARVLDPQTPGLTQEDFDEAEARSLASDAETLAAQGNADAAFAKYREAISKRSLPDIERAMNSVKARVARNEARLKKARSLAQRKRYRQALTIYDALVAEGARGAAEDEGDALRSAMVAEAAESAQRLSESGRVRAAHDKLNGIVRDLDLNEEEKTKFRKGLTAIRDGEPVTGLSQIKASGIEQDSAVWTASESLALAQARSQIALARKLSRRNPAKAITMLAALSPFQKRLPELVSLQDSLQSAALDDILAESLRAAQRGKDVEAAAALEAALSASNAADEAAKKTEAGVVSLRQGRYAEAEAKFRSAASGSPQLRVTTEAIRVAEIRRKAAEKDALRALQTKSLQSENAVDVLEASYALSAANPSVLEAKRLLEKRLQTKLSNREAAQAIGWLARLSEMDDSARAALEEGADALEAGRYEAAQQSFAQGGDGPLAKKARAIAAARVMKGLNAQIQSARLGQGELSSIKGALERAYAQDPGSPQTQKAVEALLLKGDQAVAVGQYAVAAETYEAASIVTSPDARSALLSALALLKAGKLRETTETIDQSSAVKSGQVGARIRAAAFSARQKELLSAAKTLQGIKEAKDPEELGRAALRVRALLRQDSTSADGRLAVQAVLDNAYAAAEAGDGETVARDLGLAADALGQSTVTRRAISMVRRGKLDDAEASFTQNEGDLKVRGPKIVAALRINSLRSGLSEGGLAAARNVRDLLRANPSDPQAKRAFQAIVSRIMTAARAGEAEKAAEALREANIAAAPGEALFAAIDEGARPLSERRYVDAELRLVKAKSELPTSEVLDTGLKAARTLRAQQEAAAMKGLAQDEDPRSHADVLARSKSVGGSSKLIAQGLKVILARADKAAQGGDVTLLSRSLTAAGTLEATTAEGAVSIKEAAELITTNQLPEAEAAFLALRGQTSEAGTKTVRAIRIARVRAEVASAKTSKDVLSEARAIKQLLELAPKDRAAKRREALLVKEVKSTRVSAAKRQMELGKPGLAYLYLSRALELDPQYGPAKQLRSEAKKKLEGASTLIMVVESVRGGAETRACKPMANELQQVLMRELSKETGLGGYVLSANWTQAWRQKDPKAPTVTGGLAAIIESCKLDSAAGSLSASWKLFAPKEGREVTAGSVTAEVPRGSLLKDEQSEGKVRNRLAETLTKKLATGLQSEGARVKSWLLTTAEHALEAKAYEEAADAFARFLLNPPKSADPERVEVVRTELERAFP